VGNRRVSSARALACLALLAGCVYVPEGPPSDAPGPGPAPPPASPPGSDPGARPADPDIARFADLLDARRARDGCPALAWDHAVADVAAAHSRDMAERGYFSHVSPEGRDPFHRLQAAGIAFVAAAENIAYGRDTGDGLFEQWLASPGHRGNMLDCRFTRHGVGRHGVHWTQLLIRPPS
jgi:uncharacterized protein YkwD